MRRRKIAALMMTLAMLSACGGRTGEAEFESFRASLGGETQITMTADVTAETDTNADAYTLKCVSTPQESAVEVLAPEIIAGVKARMTEGSSTLEYDGLMLGVPELTGDGLSPVSALPRILSALREGYAETVWREDGRLAVQIKPDDTLAVTVWFSGEGVPARAEIASQSDGKVLIYCDITEFSIG